MFSSLEVEPSSHNNSCVERSKKYNKIVLVLVVFINAVDIVVFSIFLVVAFVVVVLFFCLSLVSSCRSSLHCSVLV